MPAIITQEFRVASMTNFIAAFAHDPGETYFRTFYMGLAKNDPWPTDGAGRIETDSGFVVPTPSEDDAVVEVLWDDIIALKRVYPADLQPVIREITWESGDKWKFEGVNPNMVKKSFSSTDLYKSVIRNSQGKVYQCKAEPSTGTCYISGSPDGNYTSRSTCEAQLNSVWVPTASNAEPIGLPPTQGADMVFGNYTWEYLWEFGVNEIATHVNEEWQPVQYSIYSEGSPEHTNQITYGTHPTAAIRKAESNNIMIRIFLSSSDVGIPDDDDFRQLILIDSPKDTNGEICVNPIYNKSGLSNDKTGNLIFIENRLPVLRSSDQQEDIRLILQY